MSRVSCASCADIPTSPTAFHGPPSFLMGAFIFAGFYEFHTSFSPRESRKLGRVFLKMSRATALSEIYVYPGQFSRFSKGAVARAAGCQ